MRPPGGGPQRSPGRTASDGHGRSRLSDGNAATCTFEGPLAAPALPAILTPTHGQGPYGGADACPVVGRPAGSGDLLAPVAGRRHPSLALRSHLLWSRDRGRITRTVGLEDPSPGRQDTAFIGNQRQPADPILERRTTTRWWCAADE